MAANESVSPAIAVAAGRVCPDCGYDLHGIDSARCPECGWALDGAAGFVVPWEQREQIGRFTAFWRTVRLAGLRPNRLAMAVAGPVEYASAQRFRWAVVALASLPPVVLFLVVVWSKGGTGFLGVAVDGPTPFVSRLATAGSEIGVVWSAGATFVPVLPVGVGVAFFLATGACGYWFRPGHLDVVRQNRAVAVSRYACGPLAGLPLLAALAAAVAGLTVGGYLDYVPASRDWIILGALAFVILAACWRTSLVLLARTTHCGAGHLVSAGFGLVLSWLVSAAIGLGAVPLAVGFLWIVIDSFR